MSEISRSERWKVPTFDGNGMQMGVVEFNDNCTGCGICAKICPAGALETINKKSQMKTNGECMFCGDCAAICPKNAVVMKSPYQFKYFYKTIDRGEPKLPRSVY